MCSDEYHSDRKMENTVTEISIFYKHFTETNTQLASLNECSTVTVTKFMLNKTKIFKLFSNAFLNSCYFIYFFYIFIRV